VAANWLLGLLVVLLSLSGEAVAVPPTATPGLLRVAVYESFPPYSSEGEGIDVDLARALAQRLGLKADIVAFRAGEEMSDDLRNMVWKGHYLGTRAADVMLHVPVDPALERANDKVRIFGSYHRESLALARDPGKLPRIDSGSPIGLEKFGDARIGVEFDSVADAHLMQALGGRLRSQVAHYRGVAAAMDALKRGEIAAVLATRGEIEGALRGDKTFAVDPYRLPGPARDSWPIGMAVKEDAAQLAMALTAALEDLRADGGLKEIFAKHGVNPVPAAQTLAWVPNEKSGSVSVIDAESYGVVNQYFIGGRPRGIAVNAKADRLYVSDAISNRLRVFSARGGKPILEAETGPSPEDVALSPDGRVVAVAVEESNVVRLFDAATLARLGDIPVEGKNPEHVAFSPDGRWLLATAEEAEQVDVIDLEARRQVARIAVGKRPRGAVFSPDGQRVYVACELASKLYVIDFARREVITALDAGAFSNGVALSANGEILYVSNGKAASVSVFDTRRLEKLADVPVGARPWNMALAADGNRLFVASGRANRIDVIGTDTRRVIKQIEVGYLPWGIALQ